MQKSKMVKGDGVAKATKVSGAASPGVGRRGAGISACTKEYKAALKGRKGGRRGGGKSY